MTAEFTILVLKIQFHFVNAQTFLTTKNNLRIEFYLLNNVQKVFGTPEIKLYFQNIDWEFRSFGHKWITNSSTCSLKSPLFQTCVKFSMYNVHAFGKSNKWECPLAFSCTYIYACQREIFMWLTKWTSFKLESFRETTTMYKISKLISKNYEVCISVQN